MDDNSWLKFIVFLGIAAFVAISIGVFLLVLRVMLIWLPELPIMGMLVILP